MSLALPGGGGRLEELSRPLLVCLKGVVSLGLTATGLGAGLNDAASNTHYIGRARDSVACDRRRRPKVAVGRPRALRARPDIARYPRRHRSRRVTRRDRRQQWSGGALLAGAAWTYRARIRTAFPRRDDGARRESRSLVAPGWRADSSASRSAAAAKTSGRSRQRGGAARGSLAASASSRSQDGGRNRAAARAGRGSASRARARPG